MPQMEFTPPAALYIATLSSYKLPLALAEGNRTPVHAGRFDAYEHTSTLPYSNG